MSLSYMSPHAHSRQPGATLCDAPFASQLHAHRHKTSLACQKQTSRPKSCKRSMCKCVLYLHALSRTSRQPAHPATAPSPGRSQTPASPASHSPEQHITHANGFVRGFVCHCISFTCSRGCAHVWGRQQCMWVRRGGCGIRFGIAPGPVYRIMQKQLWEAR